MGPAKRRILAVIYRHIVAWPRELESILEAFWWPSFDLFIWGLMTTYLTGGGGGSPAAALTGVIIGGIILWTVVYRSQQEIGFLFLKEMWDRNLLNLLTSPLSMTELVASSIILGTVKLAVSVTWMTILAAILFSFNIFSFGWQLIPFALNLLLVGWWSGFLIQGLLLRYGNRIQAFVWSLILIIQPFSAIFYPLSSTPVWMQMVSRILPTSYIFEGMRNVLTTGNSDASKILTATALNIIYLIISIYYFTRSYEMARKTGMIMKMS